MRKLSLFIACVLGVAGAAEATAGDLAIAVTDVRSPDGRVMVAVYDRSDTFMKTGQDVAAFTLSAQSLPGKVVLSDLPPGRYAVTVFHDENGNGELDANLLGVPKEGYGFSNGASGSFGPPPFDAAVVTVGDGVTDATIKLSY